jgi:aminoglycoside phosphotransferase (APT) family kinase protein
LTAAEILDRLGDFIRRETGVDSVEIRDLRKLAGGASRETWSFDAEVGRGSEARVLRLVLRRDPPGGHVQSSRKEEFDVLRAAKRAGVPVPQVYWLGDDPSILGAKFLVMERIEGEALARRLLRDDQYATARGVLARQLGEIAARIHSIDVDALPSLARPPEGESGAVAELERYRQIYRAIAPEPHPAIELALRWLETHLPEPAPLGLVHGDYRVGNVMFGPEGVRAILDWELAHAGDPTEDLGWACVRAWRFGNDEKPVGGVGEREELFEAYERVSGRPVDRRCAHFWEVFGNARWAIMCIMQAKTYLDGLVPSVELASLGRRTSETEIELVSLLEQG